MKMRRGHLSDHSLHMDVLMISPKTPKECILTTVGNPNRARACEMVDYLEGASAA
jgi:hypothetical protein